MKTKTQIYKSRKNKQTNKQPRTTLYNWSTVNVLFQCKVSIKWVPDNY